MNRIMILGQPGSGKSTLARELASRTGLPVVHCDRLHWKPGWVERDRDEKIAMALEEQARPRWIFEGGLSATYDDRAARADMIVFLDLPVGLRLRRVVWRAIRNRGRTRPDLPENCPERPLSRDFREFLKWIWDTRQSGRVRKLEIVRNARPDQKAVHLRSPAEVRRFLRGLDAAPVAVQKAPHGTIAH